MGQTCTAGTRLYVHKDIADTILIGLKEFPAKMTVGAGLNPKTQIGPLVSEEQVFSLSQHIFEI
jgi:phenylacetaldehyde dehydrogenase